MQHTAKDNCRFCGFTLKKIFIDLGKTPLANSYLKYNQIKKPEKKIPLKVFVCKNCFLVQLKEYESPKKIFSEYAYLSSYSTSWLKHAEDYVSMMIKRFHFNKKNLVMEIASNDGYLLQYFQQNKIPILGIEPAKNIAKIARRKGIPTINEFFNYDTAKNIARDYGKWDVCIARNVIAHVSDLHGLVQGIQTILDKDGFALIEFPHLQKMYSDLQYDQVFHEHIGYHSLHSIVFLFGLYNMEVFDVEELEVHGGSLRVYVKHAESKKEIKYSVVKTMNNEIISGIFSLNNWTTYANRCNAHKNTLRGKIEKCKNDGLNIIIYGASGKGQSLIQMSGFTNDLISGVVDKSKMKQGKLTPGSHIKIYPTEYIYEGKANVILLCAWNIAKEIVSQEKRFVELGGKFLLPFPEPHFYNK